MNARTSQRFWLGSALFLVGLLLLITSGPAITDEFLSGIVWPEPPVVTPGEGTAPPSDAKVLFDGKSLSAWNGAEGWEVKEGVAIPKNGQITSKEAFGDCQLHVEFATPSVVEGSGQGRGNSGIYFMGNYEVQVLDSFQNPTYFDGQCGAVYKQQPPMVNASRKPGEWQTYDIVFHAPRFDGAGKVMQPASFTVLHNNVLVQDHTIVQGTTAWDAAPQYHAHGEREPLVIQFHGNPVRFRNIWLRELHPIVGTLPARK